MINHRDLSISARQHICRAKPKCCNCSRVKCAATVLWFCLPSSVYVRQSFHCDVTGNLIYGAIAHPPDGVVQVRCYSVTQITSSFMSLLYILENMRLRYSILPPNLNNNWMTAVIGWFHHVTDYTTLPLVGVEYHIWSRYDNFFCFRWEKVQNIMSEGGKITLWIKTLHLFLKKSTKQKVDETVITESIFFISWMGRNLKRALI